MYRIVVQQSAFVMYIIPEKEVCRDFRHIAGDGKEYTTRFYYLDAIIPRYRDAHRTVLLVIDYQCVTYRMGCFSLFFK